MIARPRGKPIHYLANVSRWIWLLIGGGALLFVGMACAGVYISLRWWRCPYCRRPLNTKGALPERCPRCGKALRET